jgi:Family of unknown function (DUF6058)
VLPRASYVLPDGTPMVPADHAALLDAAGGDPDRVKAVFAERWTAAGGEAGEADEIHSEWLGGVFGCCLRSTTPESIAVKAALMAAIDALLARPVPDDDAWRGALRGAVDALDAHERPFARSDRERFGGPVTRDRYIIATRGRFPDVWS